MTEKNDHYLSLEKMYVVAPINKIYNPKILIYKGGAEIEIAVKEKFFHAAGAVHGSVYFKMLDDAAFFAANSLEQAYLYAEKQFPENGLHVLQP